MNWSTNYQTVGGGGLMTTVGDLLLWDRNFYEGKLGKGTLPKQMLTRGTLNDGTENMYALGLMLNTYRGLPVVEHNGGTFGYRSTILRFPEQRFSVVSLCNVASANPDRLSRQVADIYLEKEFPPARATAGSDPAQFQGEYFDARVHYPISFTVEGGKLVLQGDLLEPVGPSQFEDPIVKGVVNFTNANGKMNATVTYNHAVTFSGERIGDFHVDEPRLGDYAGIYKSVELDATYNLSVENGKLMLRMNWSDPAALRPVVHDEFEANGMTLVFGRNKRSRISGLSVFAGWDGVIRNEKFDKTN